MWCSTKGEQRACMRNGEWELVSRSRSMCPMGRFPLPSFLPSFFFSLFFCCRCSLPHQTNEQRGHGHNCHGGSERREHRRIIDKREGGYRCPRNRHRYAKAVAANGKAASSQTLQHFAQYSVRNPLPPLRIQQCRHSSKSPCPIVTVCRYLSTSAVRVTAVALGFRPWIASKIG